MSFLAANRSYESWMRTQCEVVEDDLDRKHERMKESSFLFLRATFFRWPYFLKHAAADVLKMPAPLAVGDAHVENFGTWRDAEVRLVWGINDHDDASYIPYGSDLLRLAVSVRLASFGLANIDAATAILEGYEHGLKYPGPTILDENERWMRKYVAVTDDERDDFWDGITKCPDADPPKEARSALLGSLPASARVERFARRRKGGGSLGRPRFIVIAGWQGGQIVREAKALIPSGWEWATGNPGRPSRFEEIAKASTRSPDPFLGVRNGFIVRRLSPDARKIERSPEFDRKLDSKLLRAMGSEVGSIHAYSSEIAEAIVDDLKGRDGSWLHAAAKALIALVEADYQEWKDSEKS
ncbi:DUF2252 family protein [Bradyrhizobium sp. B097]|uniref:DUF2252 family protein n=1 Tax=Bradyrhizobium sp. B097 TaxID=3140244 RepID=UPI0031835196